MNTITTNFQNLLAEVQKSNDQAVLYLVGDVITLSSNHVANMVKIQKLFRVDRHQLEGASYRDEMNEALRASEISLKALTGTIKAVNRLSLQMSFPVICSEEAIDIVEFAGLIVQEFYKESQK